MATTIPEIFLIIQNKLPTEISVRQEDLKKVLGITARASVNQVIEPRFPEFHRSMHALRSQMKKQ